MAIQLDKSSIVKQATDISKIANLDILRKAFYDSNKTSMWKGSVQRFQNNLMLECLKLKDELENKTYTPSNFTEFNISERGKKRHITALSVRDRVVQRAYCDVILNKALKKHLIYDNGASVKGKGIDFTRKRLVSHLQKYYRKHGNQGYVLKVDFKNFFGSIPREKAAKAIKSKLNDNSTYWLLDRLIDIPKGLERGVGIGSQLSQIIGIYYPTQIDNYCKICKGLKFYGRYMDDIYIISHSKPELERTLEGIKNIAHELGLNINVKKTYIGKLEKGFTFLKIKYTLLPTGKIIKKPHRSRFKRIRARIKKYKAKVKANIFTEDEAIGFVKSQIGSLKHYHCRKSLLDIKKKARF